MISKLSTTASRGLSWLDRVARGMANLTFLSTLELFLLRNTPAKPRVMRFRFYRERFLYRGNSDYNVMAHFYNDGYDIRPDGGADVRWIFDLGANIGDETVKFALRHPTARILALEPEEQNYRLLQLNAGQFGTRIQTMRSGIWKKDSRLEVVQGSSNEAFTVRESRDGLIEGRSISSLMQELKADRIDILKLDCEGAEHGLFAHNAEQWIDRVRCIIMEVADHETPGTTQAMFTALAASGLHFNFSICGENIIGIREGTGLRLEKKRAL